MPYRPSSSASPCRRTSRSRGTVGRGGGDGVAEVEQGPRRCRSGTASPRARPPAPVAGRPSRAPATGAARASAAWRAGRRPGRPATPSTPKGAARRRRGRGPGRAAHGARRPDRQPGRPSSGRCTTLCGDTAAMRHQAANSTSAAAGPGEQAVAVAGERRRAASSGSGDRGRSTRRPRTGGPAPAAAPPPCVTPWMVKGARGPPSAAAGAGPGSGSTRAGSGPAAAARCSRRLLALDVDVRQDPVEPARQPPGARAEQRHRPPARCVIRTTNASMATPMASAKPIDLMIGSSSEDEAGEHRRS